MKKIKIVADSSCDMFELKHAEFETAPMKIITAEREFVDDISLDVDDMANFLYQRQVEIILSQYDRLAQFFWRCRRDLLRYHNERSFGKLQFCLRR